MRTWGVRPELILNYEKLVRGNTKWLTYTKTTTEIPRFLLTQLHFPDNSLVILDEAHRCKSPNSLATGIMIACKRQNYKCLNLSATLAVDPRDMKAIGYINNLINQPYSKEYKQFCIDHGAEWLGKWGALVFNADDEKAQSKMRAIHHSLFDIQKSASRLTRKQMAEHFPKSHLDATPYSMNDISTKKIQSVYDWLEAELCKLYEHTDNYGECILSLISAARQKIELLKVPLYCELVENAYEEGNSVVCFVNYTRTLEAINTQLKHNKGLCNQIGYIYGKQKYQDRLQDIYDFQNDNKRILLANQAAGGVAIDLHDLNGKYPRYSILSATFNAREFLQAAGRTDRVGAATPCYMVLAYVAGTIEDRACRNIQNKLNNLSLLNDGDLNMGINLYKK
jgi:superfamily II DNA or RNA helicase